MSTIIPTIIPTPVLIANKYKIIAEIGEGAFGKVFKAEHILSKTDVAIKIERNKDSRLLKYEARIYNLISGVNNVPKIRNFGTEENYTYLVMDLFGSCIDKVVLSNKEKIEVFIKCIKILSDIHDLGLIHRDIKPDNFLFSNNDGREIKLIDFGLTKYYINSNKEHLPIKTNKKIIGTINYASLNIHNGFECSRRDDLESLCYTFIKVYCGALPWSSTKVTNKDKYIEDVSNLKKDAFITLLNMPGEIITMLSYCRNLTYDETPNYKYLNNLFTNYLSIIPP